MTAHDATPESAKLVRMANQIAAYFHAYPEATALAGVRKHLVDFWTPRMLQDLRAHAGDAGLDKLVQQVIPSLPEKAA